MPDVLMPKLSDTMEEGRIIKWMKQPGDAVAIGDILAEVETDKANMELEAFDEGVLAEVRTAEGESAPVGSVIAVLAEPGAAATAKSTPTPAPAQAKTPPAARPAPARPAPERPRPVPARRPEPAAPADGERVKASPLARRIASDHHVDLSQLRGTGPGGRIVEDDVRAAIETARAAAAPQAPAPASHAAAPAPQTPAPPPAARAAATGGRRVELSRIRRTTAKRMLEAKQTIPHFYASSDIAMDEAVRLKEALVALEGEYGGLTYTHLVLKAAGLALRRVPELNATYDGDAVVLADAVNIGLATATDDGLIVPVVRNGDREPLAALVRQVTGLVERARAGRFATDDLSGGTFTISNLGMFPVAHFAAVVNPPQAGILAVSAIRSVPVVRDGQVVPGKLMTVTLSCDHRVVDGVLAGRFLRELKALLENPLALVA